MRFTNLTRTLLYGGWVALALLGVALLAMPALASPEPGLHLHYLPTRPQPTSTPVPMPSPTAPPPANPTATSQPPTPTPTATVPAAPSPTATALPATPAITPTLVATLEPEATVQSPASDPMAPLPLPAKQVTATFELPADAILTKSIDLTFEELGYDTSKLWEDGTRSVYLYLPGNLVPNNDESYLDLTISHVPAQPDKLSVLKVELNGLPWAVITLSEENAELTTYRLYTQHAPLVPGRNRIEITLDAGAGCNVGGAKVDVAVHNTSFFHLEYALVRQSPDLALYPVPFFEQSFEYEPVYVVLPDDPSGADLSAAATLAAGLGRFSEGEVELVSVSDVQISTEVRDGYHLIVVGKEGANRLLDQLDLPLRLDDPALSEEQGVIQELVSPWNPLRMILVVTGRSDEGLLKASQALNREGHLLGMRGQVAIVETVIPPDPAVDDQLYDDFTLADLGYEEEIVYGTEPHTLDYRFFMPLGWTTTAEPRLTLYFAHARVADPAHSSLTVKFNDVPIDSVLLDESNASEGALEVTLPSWLIQAGRNKIYLAIEMNLVGEDKCLFLDAGHLWTTIYSHSYFHVPYVPQEVEPSLATFPHPFNSQPGFGDLLLVLPDHPQQSDYDLMLGVAAGLGAADRRGFLTLSATTSSLLAQEERPDKHLIVMGRPSANSLIAELNDLLPQPFEPGTDLFHPQIESVVFVQDPPRDVGLIEELAAPWNPERTILVLTGTTDAGVALAGAALFSGDDELVGNVSIVEESIGIRSLDTRVSLPAETAQAESPASGQAQLSQLGDRWW